MSRSFETKGIRLTTADLVGSPPMEIPKSIVVELKDSDLRIGDIEIPYSRMEAHLEVTSSWFGKSYRLTVIDAPDSYSFLVPNEEVNLGLPFPYSEEGLRVGAFGRWGAAFLVMLLIYWVIGVARG